MEQGVSFGRHRFDLETGRLWSGKREVKLTPKASAVLKALVTHAGQPVRKDELFAEVWTGTVVSDDALTSCIQELRRALADDAKRPRFIETRHRSGYRFLARVSKGAGREAAVSYEALRTQPAIAVLPFANMSGEPEQEYFSDGITEDIITDLSKVSALNVLSRSTTFALKGKSVDIGRIAQRLKIGYVVEGSVRKAGGRVRITAQLVDAAKNSHVWAERYDRELNDIFALQDEIAQAIVAALKIRLVSAEKKAIESRSTHDPKAYELYLLGRYYLRQLGARNLEIAVRYCRRALEVDVNYARAWALLALCQASLYLRGRAEESGLSAAEKALALDPTLAEAHAARGRVLAELGHHREALAAHEESLRLEPDSFEVRHNFGLTCLHLGRYEQTIEHCERAAELLGTDYLALSLAANCYRLLGRHDELKAAARRALERLEKEIAQHLDNAMAMTLGAIALAYLGEKERAKELASQALMIEPDDAVGLYNVACAFAQMDQPDHALDLLESSVRNAPPKHLAFIKQDPDLTTLHRHPRFKALIAREEARLGAGATERVAVKSVGALSLKRSRHRVSGSESHGTGR